VSVLVVERRSVEAIAVEPAETGDVK